MAMPPISAGPFEGLCEACGDEAEIRGGRSSALIQNLETKVLSAVGMGLVRCMSGDHAYYVLLHEQRVEDPWAEGEPKLPFELPPPPD